MDKAAAAAAAAAMTMAPPSGPAPRDIPLVHDGGRFEFVRDLGSGNFGVARLMRDTATGDLVAIKYIARGEAIDENVRREVVNHLQLRHPNIIRLNEVLLTPTHLGMVMEYAAGGELYARICNAGRFNEPEARYFFQQLISGVSYLHSMQICHRDLKLENALLDGSSTPWLKICDFGYSKSTILHSEPRTTVGTPVYIAPETVLRQVYDGKIADVWSCGVTLYVMLFGSYPFHDPQQPRDYRVTVQKVLQVLYEIPDNVHVSPECIDLLKRIFVAAPHCRITMAEIKSHPWYLLNLPIEMDEDTRRYQEPDQPMQKMDEVMQILAEATMLPPVEPRRMTQDFPDSLDMEEDMEYMYMDSDSESHSGSGSDSGSGMDEDTRNRNSWEDVEAL